MGEEKAFFGDPICLQIKHLIMARKRLG